MTNTEVSKPHVVTLREIAVVRTGDKSNMINLAVIPFDTKHYQTLVEQLTCDVVIERYKHLGAIDITRHLVDGISALNFTISGVLDGGVSRSLSLDLHGKSLGTLLALVEIDLSEAEVGS